MTMLGRAARDGSKEIGLFLGEMEIKKGLK